MPTREDLRIDEVLRKLDALAAAVNARLDALEAPAKKPAKGKK